MSQPNLVRIDNRKPVPEVVGLLRFLLEKAEAGEIVGIAVGCHCDGAAQATSYELGEGSVDTLVTAIERLKLRLLDLS